MGFLERKSPTETLFIKAKFKKLARPVAVYAPDIPAE